MIHIVTVGPFSETTPPPALALPAAPVTLAYDELPVGSDLRRDFGGDGAVTVTAPAGEPSLAARRSAAQRTGISSAAFCAASLAVLVWAAWPSVVRLDASLRAVAAALFVVFSGGVFLLMWKVSYAAHFDLLTEARRETVVLHADARGLLIETAGPKGERSVNLRAGDVGTIRAAGGRDAARQASCLRIDRTEGPALCLLAGRHPAELRWVAATLSQALGRRVNE